MNLTTTACGAPIRNRGAEFNAISIGLGTVAAVAVFIRLAYHYLSSASSASWDDWFIVATLAVGIAGNVINSVGLVSNGLGRDVWKISFDALTTFIQWFYYQEIIYFLQISLLKTSILLFYLRIFGHTQIRISIIGTLAFNVLYGLVFVFVAAFQCRPIKFYWTKWHGEDQGRCLNVNAIAWANAAISIALDFWMIALPLSQITSLNMHWKKKVGVVMMFCVGIFVTVVSILRLQTLVAFANTHNPTWDQYEVTKWSTIEISVGIICACMPALRLAIGRFFPRVLGSTKRDGAQSAGLSSRSIGPNRGTMGSHAAGPDSVARRHDQEIRIRDNLSKGAERNVQSRDGTIDYHDETRLVPLRDLNQV